MTVLADAVAVAAEIYRLREALEQERKVIEQVRIEAGYDQRNAAQSQRESAMLLDKLAAMTKELEQESKALELAINKLNKIHGRWIGDDPIMFTADYFRTKAKGG